MLQAQIFGLHFSLRLRIQKEETLEKLALLKQIVDRFEVRVRLLIPRAT
jgi:hypothetical protein